MFKMIKRVGIIVICLLIVIATVSSRSMSAISRSWHIDLDMQVFLSDQVDFLNDLPLENVRIPYILTFNSDRTYSFELDEEKFEQQMPLIREAAGAALMDNIEQQGVDKLQSVLEMINVDAKIQDLLDKYDFSLNQMLNLVFKVTGLSFDDILNKALPDEMLISLFSDVNAQGQYAALAGFLFITDKPGDKMDFESYLSFEIEDNVLHISNGGLTHEKLPLDFVR